MAIKKYYENPKVTDQIEFDLFAPDADGCFDQDPFKFDNIKIYFVERDLNNLKNEASLVDSFDIDAQKAYLEAQQKACENPTQTNIANAQKLKDAFDAGSIININYYTEANIVYNNGSSTNPLWVRDGDNSESVLTKIIQEDSEIQNGYFKFIWTPGSIREGDFYICYTYTPNMSGDSISEYLHFYVQSNIANEVANPAHITKPEKYITLLDRYLPEMYKETYAKNDLTISTITRLNEAIASGFTEVENLANQLIDIIDANATQEPLLGFLANFFGLKLRSTDLTQWRKQIKKAVPVFKMKGTLKGLEEALMDAGIRLNKYTQFWQTGTDFSYTETFTFADSYSFTLTKVSLAINSTYFKIYKRSPSATNTAYVEQLLTDITIETNSGVSTMTWIGDPLIPGDVLRITYQTKVFANGTEISIYNYIQTLPLADTRDDRNFDYPPKDWNTRLIADDDVLFDVVVPVRNPFVPELNFGKVRTQFPYSENVYNMEEYNGSLRDSKFPCDIDKSFIDPCRSAISAYYMLDVDIADLSNTRLTECQEIVADYTPFHATLHTLNFTGSFEDFVLPPIENVEVLVKYNGSDVTIVGMAQTVFNRAMQYGLQVNAVYRDSLANMTLIQSGSAVAFNDYINLFCPEVAFDQLGLSQTPINTLLEILSPAFYSGEYTVSNPNNNYVRLEDAISEPLNTSNFSFRLSNIMFIDIDFDIVQANDYTLTDDSTDLSFYDIKSVWDVENGYATDPWQIRITSTGLTYDILDFTDNVITLDNDGTLSNTSVSGIEYVLLNEADVEILSSNAGDYVVTKFGKVTVPPSLMIEDVRNILVKNNYFYWDSDNSQYEFHTFIDGETQSFLIKDWDSGTQNNQSGKILQRLVDENIGSFVYDGMKITKPVSWPVFNASAFEWDNQNFKENYILVISGSNYYFIDEAVDGDGCLHIGGKFLDFGVASGSSTNYSLYQFSKETITLFGEELYDLSRNGQEIINSSTETGAGFAMSSMSLNDNSGVNEYLKNLESVKFKIEYKDGNTQQGEI